MDLVLTPVIVGPKTLTAQDYIKLYSVKYGVDTDIALRVAKCESNFIPNAQNSHSSAGGVFQFIDSTFYWIADEMGIENAKKYDAKTNIEMGMYLAKNYGWKHWECYNKKMI